MCYEFSRALGVYEPSPCNHPPQHRKYQQSFSFLFALRKRFELTPIIWICLQVFWIFLLDYVCMWNYLILISFRFVLALYFPLMHMIKLSLTFIQIYSFWNFHILGVVG